jgi:hypothetical protein
LGTTAEKIKIPGSYVGIGNVFNPSSGFVLDVFGNAKFTQDCSINTLTVGLGGGNLTSNTTIGFQALKANTSGTGNTAFGYQDLSGNTSGSYNTANGYQALYSNTDGSYNTAIGYQALKANNHGFFNTANGYNALQSNIDGSNNTANGSAALQNNISGYFNTAIGSGALKANKIGTYCTGIGYNAASTYDASGNYNTYLGSNTDCSSNLLVNNSTAIGYNAIIDVSNQIVLGTTAEKIKIPGSYVGIKKFNPSSIYTLDVSGSVNIDGSCNALAFSVSSDYRIKENVELLNETYNIDLLKPVTYFNTKSGVQDIGLIAHELQEIYPELVNGVKDGPTLQSVNYIGIIPIIIREIQGLKKEIDQLKLSTFEKGGPNK